MGLSAYRKKRKPGATPEPAGGKPRARTSLEFVVQRHKATRLHYDFRIEIDGVLKSWAVPKGPSMNPSDRRLAMMVEDHPFDYKDFAGVIPEGNYGAGIVEIWDSGTVTDLDGSAKTESEKRLKAGLRKGDLKFVLHGRKLKGEFVLVRMRTAGENAWLLIKHRDEFAVEKPYDSEAHTPARSPINRWLERHGKPVARKPRRPSKRKTTAQRSRARAK